MEETFFFLWHVWDACLLVQQGLSKALKDGKTINNDVLMKKIPTIDNPIDLMTKLILIVKFKALLGFNWC